MSLHLLTPWAGLAALAAGLPLGAWLASDRRASRARRSLGLRSPTGASRLVVPLALTVAIGLLGLAAAQPVIASSHSTSVRRDADVFVVLDTSRSMLAADRPGAPTRFDRSIQLAHRLRQSLPTAAVGLASLTDRVLPHLFPTEDRADFDATLSRSIGVQRPPPAENASGSGTDLGVLSDLAVGRFFAPAATTRVAVVLTDGESRPFDAARVGATLRRARIETVFVHVSGPAERVWTPAGKAERYRPSQGAGVELARAAVQLGGQAFEESDAGPAVAAVAAAIGNGTATRHEGSSLRALAPFVALAAFLPLGFVLWRRNIA